MSDEFLPTRTWPPECCVPAFLHGAMSVKNVAVAVPDALPGTLGVRVRADQDNPLGLALADSCYPPGISAANAEREINQLFTDLELPLRFRHVPFLQIHFGLWEDVLDAALANGVVVGLGVDFNVLMQRTTLRPAQHVLRVLAHKGDRLGVVDDSGQIAWDRFIVTTDCTSKAVLAIPDGFWMIGTEQNLHLPFALPWRPSQ